VTLDLWALLGVGALSMVLVFLPAAVRLRLGGMEWGVGNRERPLEGEPPWAKRTTRAHANLMENIPLFTILVLVAHVTERHDEITGWASLAFLAFRVTHAAVYVAGILWIRTVAYYAALAAELVIAWRIVAG
jgi:uncharacterized MAPEG superfamily protein